MFVLVPKPVVELAKIFKEHNEKLYLVGGYIRNQLLGIKDEYNLDIDVCSSVKPDKVLKMLSGTKFQASYMNKDLGVVEIVGDLRVEHATFRKDFYSVSGVHMPDKVEFIKDINEDALRRDFRCNAVYYDILGDEIVDPLDGVGDIRKRIIRTTRPAKEVFYGDGERILRMVRFAATLGFDVDQNTYEEAKKNVRKLASVSSTRKREEFSQIVLADTTYPFLPDIKHAHARGVNMLSELGALGYLMPSLEQIRQSDLIEDTGKPLFEHVMNVFAFSAPEVRLSALLHDVGKARAMQLYGNFHGSQEFAPIIIENDLGMNGLCFPKKVVERVKKVVDGVDFNKSGLEFGRGIRHFIVDNNENIELIIALKDAIALDKSGHRHGSFSANQLRRTYQKLKELKVPTTLADLNIRGDKLIQEFPNLAVNRTGQLLQKLLYICVDRPKYNNESSLLRLAYKLINKRNSPYKE